MLDRWYMGKRRHAPEQMKIDINGSARRLNTFLGFCSRLWPSAVFFNCFERVTNFSKQSIEPSLPSC
jgi:hypothetical protein